MCVEFHVLQTLTTKKKDTEKLNVITKDLWIEFETLVSATNGKWGNFEDDGSWPVTIDEFAVFMDGKM